MEGPQINQIDTEWFIILDHLYLEENLFFLSIPYFELQLHSLI